MTRAAPPQFSFASGALSPLLHYRPDYQRYTTGVRACPGFIPLPEGPLTRMPGTRHAGFAKSNDAVRLVPFIFDQRDTHVLEFTDRRMRVWRDGALIEKDGAPYELAMPWETADLPNLQFAQSGSRLYVVDGKRLPRRISRLALDDWALDFMPFENGPFLKANTDEAVTIGTDGVSGTVTLTASADVWTANHVGAFWRLEPEGENDVPYWTGTDQTIDVGDEMRYDGAVYRVVGFGDDAVPPTTSGETGPNPPLHKRGEWLASKDGPIWKYLYGDAGIVKITGFTDARTVTAEVAIELPANIIDNPTPYWAEGSWSLERGFPAALAFHEQRLVLAATPNDPQSVWFSTLADFPNFEPGTEADSSFSYVISATGNQVSAIRWIASGGRTLHIGTEAGEYSARSASADAVIGPTNAVFKPDTSEGSDRVSPLVIDGAPLFVARGGARLHELTYDFGQDRVDAPQLTQAARHIFAAGIRELAWQTNPVRIVWAVLGDGRLGGLAYDRRQEQIGGFVSAVAGGRVESLAVIPTATGEDQLWLAIDRDGVMQIEIMQPVFLLQDDAPESDAWHLWNALDYAGASTASFAGLEHLEGRAVHAWTPQGTLGPVTVAGGSATFDSAVTTAIIGLASDDRIETLHQFAGAADGGSQGRQNRVKAYGAALMRSGPATIHTITVSERHTETSNPFQIVPPGSDPFAPVPLFDGLLDLSALGPWGQETRPVFTPDPGAPFTLASLTPILQQADG